MLKPTVKHNHRKRKSKCERVERINITLHPNLRVAADTIVHQKGFVGLSDYFAASIRRDAPTVGIKDLQLS